MPREHIMKYKAIEHIQLRYLAFFRFRERKIYMDHTATYSYWKKALAGTVFSAELSAMENDEEVMRDSFGADLEFGTAGMRGIIGMGTNRMNIFTVRRATQGLADYLNSVGKAGGGVAIAYDSRRMSDVFAKETALVLAANGVKVYLYDSLHSVPQLSYTILKLHCAAGVVITASHNPPEYNGYKVYGPDGGQVAVEAASVITSFINAVDDIFSIRPMPESEAGQNGLLRYIGQDIDDMYVSDVHSIIINKEIVEQERGSLKIVYTPLFGTGNVPVRRLLSKMGIQNLAVVEEQLMPNGDFPGLSAPNPENKEVFTLAFQKADEIGADMILATDPDCDRLGVAVRRGEDWDILTGNQIGCILMDYILSARAARRKGDEFVVKSIVSTSMADAIAAHYGVEMRNVLTGFKFIAEQIQLAQESGKGTFCFGFEESYGFLCAPFVRDKDAAMASQMLTEAACYYHSKSMTLKDALDALYEKYGCFREKTISITLSGLAGIAKIKEAVAALREQPLASIDGRRFTSVSDFKTGIVKNLVTGTEQPTGLPAADMIIYGFDNGRMILRPSGTEPKLKCYLSFMSRDETEADAVLERLVSEAESTLTELVK